MNAKYDYWVRTQKIIPPIGDYRFAGKAEVYEVGVGKVSHEFGEAIGKTEAEATTEMTKKIEQWIKEQE